ncbi:sensor histidine kinase [Pedobacter sp. SYSU D00535]|uniref:sensor histidine kinase n=1 Tax=Pedobacter sp. SYSU D00535 TaxID=2810308 RepID=UPI001A95D97F|nr:sensor histidine kinase [Pedobacter sp. SYSU D00535]
MDFKKIGKHIFGWILFLFYEFLLKISGKGNFIPEREYSIHLILIFVIFYFNSFLAFNSQINLRSNPIFLCLLTLAELLIYGAFTTLSFLVLENTSMRNFNGTTLLEYLDENAWRAMYFVSLSFFYWLGVAHVKQRRKSRELSKLQLQLLAEKSEMEKKLQVSQNSFLQSQINPHLLFNTLNFIYNSVQKASDEASEMVMIVNDLMRYALREPDHEGKIELAEEVLNVENFIRLNQLRFGNKVFVNIVKTGLEEEVRIYPQVLLPLVENMFKHGDLSEVKNPALIHINYVNGILYFRAVNKKRKRKVIKSSSIGLANVKLRLNNYYPNDHEFKVQESKDSFQINLVIRLK